MTWMATQPACANQAFNVVNGDYIRWQHLWPAFARFFGLEPAPPRKLELATTMADKAQLWETLVARHGLKPYRYDELVSWRYGDIVFSSGYDIVSDMGKAWRTGWREAVDTEAMFLNLFESYRRCRIIP
jgi:hypothetical protein